MRENKRKYSPKRLVVFDVDGVILDNKIGGFKEVLILLGEKKEVQTIDQEYQKRKHLGPWGLEQLAALYKGLLKEKLKKLALKYCQENLAKGATEIIRTLKEKNYFVGALSSNPQFIMEALMEILHLDFALGTELEFRNNIATGKISKKVDRYKKAEILQNKINQLNLEKGNVIVIGDSLTDLPMAEISGYFIAFNAKKEISEKADFSIENKDFKELLKCILKI